MRDFLVPKYRNKAFIFLVSNFGQSQLHFGTKFILARDCVAKIRLNFAVKSIKLTFLSNALELTCKMDVFLFLKVLGKF